MTLAPNNLDEMFEGRFGMVVLKRAINSSSTLDWARIISIILRELGSNLFSFSFYFGSVAVFKIPLFHMPSI